MHAEIRRFMNDCENRFIHPKSLLNKYVVEQAPSPAKYSQPRLFHLNFTEVSEFLHPDPRRARKIFGSSPSRAYNLAENLSENS
jgi:hypothetical protein